MLNIRKQVERIIDSEGREKRRSVSGRSTVVELRRVGKDAVGPDRIVFVGRG